MSIICGDCLDEMRKMDDNSISAIVTDPPYGLGFMGKHWDAGLPQHEIWSEALRIVKPGGHLLAFGGTRTYHRLTCAIEDAGWEIRDCLMWLYGSGFPKSHNRFGIEGYGTALKPAYEPIIMSMKKCDGTFKQNAEKWEQAGIDIDGCRVPTDELKPYSAGLHRVSPSSYNDDSWKGKDQLKEAPKGRWPANVILDEEAGQILDEVSGFKKGSGHHVIGGTPRSSGTAGHILEGSSDRTNSLMSYGDSGGASRFFYCAKASSSERNEGLEGMPFKGGGMTNSSGRRVGNRESIEAYSNPIYKNNHPTVKPLKLMEYLIKLIMPPKDGILLDPFAGSGTTILAAHRLGMKAIGIEKQQEYCDIANARVAHHIQNNLKFG